MTRINVGIRPAELPTKLLLAELREIKRIPNMVCSGRVKLDGIPSEFGLGAGHVKFFYNKGMFTLNRYRSLLDESKLRGVNAQDFSSAWDNYPAPLFNDYLPTDRDRELIVHRIEIERGFKLLNSL